MQANEQIMNDADPPGRGRGGVDVGWGPLGRSEVDDTHPGATLAVQCWHFLQHWFAMSTFTPSWLPGRWHHPIFGYLVAVLLQVVATFGTLFLLHLFPTFVLVDLLAVLAITLVAVNWGAGPSLVATVLGACSISLLHFFVLSSRSGWMITQPESLVEILLFLIVGLGISVAASQIERGRRHTERLAVSLKTERARLNAISEDAAESAAEIEAIFDAMTDGVFMYSRDGQMLRMNAAFREIIDFDPENQANYFSQSQQERRSLWAVSDEHGQLLPYEDWPESRILRGEVLKGAEAIDVVFRALDGRTVQLNVSGAPVRNSKGELVAALCICRDVTERRRLERRTHDALSALLAMAEALVLVPDGTKITGDLENPEGKDISATAHTYKASRAAQRLVELTCSVLACERVSITAVEPETNELHPIAVVGVSPEQEQLWRARRPGFYLSAMFTDPTYTSRLLANEVLIIDMTQPPFRNQPNTYNIGVMLLAPMIVDDQLVGLLAADYRREPGGNEHEYTQEEIALARAVAKLGALVLERERLLRERAEARANELALREANRQMEEFLGMVSHELKTPLTSIKGNTQLAIRQLKNGIQAFEKTLGLYEAAERQSKRLHRLVDDLLDVSRTQTGHLELLLASCNLVTIVQESVEEQRRIWPERTIMLDLADQESVPVQADADRIGQVVTNLLTNALKYSDEVKPVHVSVRSEGEEARVSVRDEGPGLSTEDQERIWERFQRVPGIEVQSSSHASNAGLGLGLYISKMIIEQHQGHVGVHSAPDEGSTFWFTLPLAGERASEGNRDAES